jgi:uncharacterized repeat protein (TIGR03803 family)
MNGQTVSLGKFRSKFSSRVSTFAMALAIILALTLLTTHAARAQSFSVLHYFTGGADGAASYAGLTVTSSGTLYGTASSGGTYGAGTVFRLSQVDSNWVFSPLYEFTVGSDGANPVGGVVIGPNGALYGTAGRGSEDFNYGVVFELKPPATFCRSVLCYWNNTVLHTFSGSPDGAGPTYENLAFDPEGNIYGTTGGGGIYDYGTVFELTPSGGGYTESIIHNFGSGTDGQSPFAGVVLDTTGNVYGTTPNGGTEGYGTVYQLMPSNGGWLENVLANFDGPSGETPIANLIMDASGNLYGTTNGGLQNGVGQVVFKLAPSAGGWTYSVLYTFTSCGSYGGVTLDAAGDLFGVCTAGGNGDGAGWVFELTNCSETCTLVDLHDFNGRDGTDPYAGPVLDANGNLYGTTVDGGPVNCEGRGCGVVWEIAGALQKK